MNAREFKPNPLAEPFTESDHAPSCASALLIALRSEDGQRVVRLGDDDGALYVLDVVARRLDVFVDERRAYEEAGLPVPDEERVPLDRRRPMGRR